MGIERERMDGREREMSEGGPREMAAIGGGNRDRAEYLSSPLSTIPSAPLEEMGVMGDRRAMEEGREGRARERVD